MEATDDPVWVVSRGTRFSKASCSPSVVLTWHCDSTCAHGIFAEQRISFDTFMLREGQSARCGEKRCSILLSSLHTDEVQTEGRGRRRALVKKALKGGQLEVAFDETSEVATVPRDMVRTPTPALRRVFGQVVIASFVV